MMLCMNLVVVSVLYGSQSNLIEIVGGNRVGIVFFRLVSSLAIFCILFYLLYAYCHIRFYSDILAEHRLSPSKQLILRWKEYQDYPNAVSNSDSRRSCFTGDGVVQQACSLFCAARRYGSCTTKCYDSCTTKCYDSCAASRTDESFPSHATSRKSGSRVEAVV